MRRGQRYSSPRRQGRRDKEGRRGLSLGQVARGENLPTNERPETGLTGAGPQQYEDFFPLYDVVVRASDSRCQSLLDGLAGKEEGMYFLPLGFVPGPACILRFRKGQVRITAATPDVKEGMAVPTDWMKVEDLPEKIRQSLEAWKELVEGLGYEPSPWSLGLAGGVLQGELPRKYLAMGFPRFQWEGREQAFGLVLSRTDEEDELEVSRVYNRGNLPCPVEGTKFLVEQLMEWAATPLQKLIRTWAKMENSSRQAGFSRPRERR